MTEPMPAVATTRLSPRALLPLASLAIALLIAPLSLRAINVWSGNSGVNVSFLPSFEIRRARRGFRRDPIELLRYGHPEFVFVGDSMLGTRIEPQLLGELSGNGRRNVMFLYRAASGPAYWYLAFKNVLVASGETPRVTFFFFRDANMTDTMFRLQTQMGDALDEVAHAREPELDAIVAARRRGYWWRVDDVLNRAYEVDLAASWMHAYVRQWYAFWTLPEAGPRLQFEVAIEDNFNTNFRRDLAADMAAAGDDLDFHRDLPTSVLPLIARLADERGLKVCFVRVQRRPEHGQPPPQSPALQRYADDFEQWAVGHGHYFHDDTGDPEMTLDLYGDGDHVADKLRYTRIFRRRLDALLR